MRSSSQRIHMNMSKHRTHTQGGRHDREIFLLTFKVRSANSPPPGSLRLVGNSYFLLNVAPSSTNLRFLS